VEANSQRSIHSLMTTKLFRLPWLAFGLASLAGSMLRADDAPALAAPEVSQLFKAGADGYMSYRIPVLVVTKAGTVLAFCEARKLPGTDQGPIDTVLRRSRDGGRTWDAMEMVAAGGDDTLGNPCPVVDEPSGTVFLALTRNDGRDTEEAIRRGTSRQPRTVWMCHSADDGRTWTKPEDISRTTRQANWGWYSTGPDNGIQLRSGRLVVPCHHSIAPEPGGYGDVIISDDHGLTWRVGGDVGNFVGENAVVELADGRLLMNARPHGHHRSISYSSDAGETWGPVAEDAGLPDPGCQGTLVRYSLTPASRRNRLLFCNPNSLKKREHLTVRLSYDEGQTWPVAREIEPNRAGYSSLAALADGSVGCFYENRTANNHAILSFARFSIAWLTDGKDDGK
jgi:sialidase-1